MAGASLLTLLDDITSVLDDVALMSKVAAKKTAGVLGDDLALNAQQVSGVQAAREIPVVWGVAKGSFRNKLILVPSALLISSLAPWLITPMLLLGGLYLCYEGAEKVAEKLFHHASDEKQASDDGAALMGQSSSAVDEYEKKKIQGAIRTDFILSLEIIVIALGTVQGHSLLTQIIVVSAIAFVMTCGVYGLVAAIVKLDDLGFYLQRKKAAIWNYLGNGLVATAPRLMKLLTLVGTAAMFLVGGGIIEHSFHTIQTLLMTWQQPWLSIVVIKQLLPLLTTAVLGFGAGVVLVALSALIKRFRG